jgi:carboxylesterase
MTLTTNAFDLNWMHNGKHLGIPSAKDLMALDSFQQKHNNDSNSALLLLHGFSSSPAVFRFFYPQLTHYQSIYAPLLKGHGKSIHDFSLAKASDWIGEVELTLTKLCKKYKKVDVLGLSMGGLIAAHLVDNFPIRHLYLLAPALALHHPIHRLKSIANFSSFFGFCALRNQGGNLCHSQNAELAYRQLPISIILEILNLIENYEHKNWTTPTTLFLGQHDKVVHSMKVAEILRSLPRLKTYFLEHSAHVLPIDNDYRFILNTIIHSHHQI